MREVLKKFFKFILDHPVALLIQAYPFGFCVGFLIFNYPFLIPLPFIVLFIDVYRQICYNPYKLFLYFGRKGSGKSTHLAKLAIQHKKKGWHVFSNLSINYPGIQFISSDEITSFSYPPHSVIFCDEAGLVFDNRHFKSFKDSDTEFFKLMRHKQLKFYLFSQSYDIDKKIRDLTDSIIYVKNIFTSFSICIPYYKKIGIVQNANGESTFSDVISKEMCLPSITFIPFWIPYFDTRTEHH